MSGRPRARTTRTPGRELYAKQKRILSSLQSVQAAWKTQREELLEQWAAARLLWEDERSFLVDERDSIMEEYKNVAVEKALLQKEVIRLKENLRRIESQTQGSLDLASDPRCNLSQSEVLFSGTVCHVREEPKTKKQYFAVLHQNLALYPDSSVWESKGSPVLGFFLRDARFGLLPSKNAGDWSSRFYLEWEQDANRKQAVFMVEDESIRNDWISAFRSYGLTQIRPERESAEAQNLQRFKSEHRISPAPNIGEAISTLGRRLENLVQLNEVLNGVVLALGGGEEVAAEAFTEK